MAYEDDNMLEGAMKLALGAALAIGLVVATFAAIGTAGHAVQDVSRADIGQLHPSTTPNTPARTQEIGRA